MTRHTGAVTRLAEARDAGQLKALWKTVFGDEDADIELYFDTYFSPELTAVVGDGMNPVSAAYILPVGALALPDGRRLACAMLYAIATHPDFRGRGYGEAVTRAACAQAVKLGFPAVVLKPADQGLFAFYESRTRFRAFFEADVSEYAAADLPTHSPRLVLSPVSPAEYRRIRQRLLKNCAHIDMDERALAYQLCLCQKTGGGLYALLNDNQSSVNAGAALGNAGAALGCAVIEREGGGTVHIKELLLSDGCRNGDAVSAATGLLPAEKYIVRALPGTDKSKNKPFGMLTPPEGCSDVPYVYSAKWYGPAFD